MTPKPAPKTVHHPLASFENLLTLRRSRLHRRGSQPTQTTLLASRRSRSFLPATALTATNTLRCSRPSSLSHSAHDFEHLAMSSAMLAAMQLPRWAHLSVLTFAIFAAQPIQSSTPLDVHVRTCRWVATFRVRLSTITSCLPSRCLRPRSSFDVRIRIHAPVSTSSVLANGPRQSLCAFTLCFAPCEANKARSPSRARVRVRLSTLTAGRTPSAHSPRAREFVSRFDSAKLRSSFGSRTAAPCCTRQSLPCSSCDDHDRVAVRISSSTTHLAACST